jgi:hypothetical protein
MNHVPTIDICIIRRVTISKTKSHEVLPQYYGRANMAPRVSDLAIRHKLFGYAACQLFRACVAADGASHEDDHP